MQKKDTNDLNPENILDRLFTPKQLAERGFLSLASQWKEREKGRLKCFKLGSKIFYNEQQIADYLSRCETG